MSSIAIVKGVHVTSCDMVDAIQEKDLPEEFDVRDTEDGYLLYVSTCTEYLASDDGPVWKVSEAESSIPPEILFKRIQEYYDVSLTVEEKETYDTYIFSE
jgi:hypothetical protein